MSDPFDGPGGLPEPRSKDTGSFSAVFDELELVDVLQLLHQARRSATVVLEGHGAIHFERGELRHAQAGELRGRAALENLLSVDAGDVKVKDARPCEVSLVGSFQGLLLDTLTRLDEDRAAVETPRNGARAVDPFAGLSPESAGTGAFEWGPASPAPGTEDRSAEAFDALLDFEFEGDGPARPVTPGTPAAPIVIPPPRVAPAVSTPPLDPPPAPRSGSGRTPPAWKQMTDARRSDPPKGRRHTTTGQRVYRVPSLPEPVVEIRRGQAAPAPAQRTHVGLLVLVAVLCTLLGLAIAALVWGPARTPEPAETPAVEIPVETPAADPPAP